MLGYFGETVHLAELRLRAASNLLCPQLHQLALQFIQLLPQVLLVLAPKLRSPNLSRRLCGVLAAGASDGIVCRLAVPFLRLSVVVG